jgi:hypothetical protein
MIYLLQPIVEIQWYVIELFKSGEIGPFSTLKTLLYRSKPGSVDLITTKQNKTYKLPSFIDRLETKYWHSYNY